MQGTRSNRLKLLIRIAISLLIVGLCILFDQLTKSFFKTELARGERLFVIPDFFYFTYTVNTGAAWSFLADESWSQLFFKIVTVFALIIFFVVLVFSIIRNRKFLTISLSFIIGGTIGNFIDRLAFNGVVDFIGFLFGDYSFPIFNLADSFLVIGIILFVIYLCFIDKNAIFKFSKKKEDNSINTEDCNDKSSQLDLIKGEELSENSLNKIEDEQENN
jgi:signal peptidase II